MTEDEKKKAEKKRKDAEAAAKALGNGMAGKAALLMSGRKKQLDDAIAAAGG